MKRNYHWWLLIFSLISFVGIVISQIRFSLQAPVLWVFLIMTAVLTFYFVISITVNVGTKNFDLEQHWQLVKNTTWHIHPSVDIFLPVCNEPIEVIRNAWMYIAQLEWEGEINIYCLDDGSDPAIPLLAQEFGFHYLSRPDKPRLQKAGNLLHGFKNSSGDFIFIFDADFCPRSEMVKEMMVYFKDQDDLAVVQSPQYFRVSKTQGWLERGAGAVQELFYRLVQQSRQQRDAAICVGTNAVYRRKALEQNGGPTQIGHSEDVHTGFDLRRLGWDLLYIPVVYSIGICPSLRSSFLAQQYRWCMGSMSLLGSQKFWYAKMTLRARFGYLSGFMYYITTAALTILAPLIPLVLLIFYPELILIENYILIAPSMVYGLLIFPIWHKHQYFRYQLDALATKMLYGWSHLFAITDVIFRTTKPWAPTGAETNSGPGTTRTILVRRFNIGILVWGGGTAILWVGMSVVRLIEGNWVDYILILLTGMLYGLVVLRCMTPSLPHIENEKIDEHIDDDVVHLPHVISEQRP